MSNSIVSYEYVYGAGSSPNRKIEFRNNNDKIFANIYRKVQGVWEKIYDIDEKIMSKESFSTSERLNIMRKARSNNEEPKYTDDRSFTKLSYDEKVHLLRNLYPNGEYRITITNNIGKNPNYEIVENLTFFNPS